MTDYGVTPAGFVAKTPAILWDDWEAKVRASTGQPSLDVRDPVGWIASIFGPAIQECAELWEALAIVYNSIDPRASTDHSYAIVAALRGVLRKFANYGTHPGVTFAFDALVPTTILRGAIRFNPTGQPNNVWINSNDLTIPDAGSYAVAVESENVGSDKTLVEAAPITIKAAPTQLTSIVVPSNATAGTDIEAESSWRTRSDDSINDVQTKLGLELEKIPGVTSARIIETAGYVRAVINDGGGTVANDVIAQVIRTSKVEGVITLGAVTGTAVNAQGESEIMRFDRVDLLQAFASVVVSAPLGVSVTAIKEAMRAKAPVRAGLPLVWSQVHAAAQGIAGVVDVISLGIGFAASPTGTTNLPAGQSEQIVLALDDIDVTVST